MTDQDLSLCISCIFSGECAEMVDELEAYECDAYMPEEKTEAEKWK